MKKWIIKNHEGIEPQIRGLSCSSISDSYRQPYLPASILPELKLTCLFRSLSSLFPLPFECLHQQFCHIFVLTHASTVTHTDTTYFLITWVYYLCWKPRRIVTSMGANKKWSSFVSRGCLLLWSHIWQW